MKLGKITISCPKCGLDRGQEVCGVGTACPKCGFKPEREIVKRKDESCGSCMFEGCVEPCVNCGKERRHWIRVIDIPTSKAFGYVPTVHSKTQKARFWLKR